MRSFVQPADNMAWNSKVCKTMASWIFVHGDSAVVLRAFGVQVQVIKHCSRQCGNTRTENPAASQLEFLASLWGLPRRSQLCRSARKVVLEALDRHWRLA